MKLIIIAKFLMLLLLTTSIVTGINWPQMNRASAEKKQAKTFINDFETLAKIKKTNADWFSNQSPFAPYLKSLSMSKRSLNQLSKEQQGRCDEVMTDIQQKFVEHNPELAEIFLKPTILTTFEEIIIPAISNSYRRCKAWQQLSYSIERSKRRTLFTVEPFLDLPFLGLKHPPKETANKEQKFLYQALKSLTHLGLCKNEKTALKDLETLSLKMFAKIFDETESLYMDAHAKALGVETKHYEMIKNALNSPKYKHQVSREPQKLLSMQAHLEAGDVSKAAKLVPALVALCKSQ